MCGGCKGVMHFIIAVMYMLAGPFHNFLILDALILTPYFQRAQSFYLFIHLFIFFIIQLFIIQCTHTRIYSRVYIYIYKNIHKAQNSLKIDCRSQHNVEHRCTQFHTYDITTLAKQHTQCIFNEHKLTYFKYYLLEPLQNTVVYM